MAAVQHGIVVLRADVHVLVPDHILAGGAVEQIRHRAGGESRGVLDAAAVHRTSLGPGQLGFRIAVGDDARHRVVIIVIMVVAHQVADAVVGRHGIAALVAVLDGAAVVGAADGAGDSSTGLDAGTDHIAVLDGGRRLGESVLHQQTAQRTEPAVIRAAVVEAGIDDAQVLDGAGDRAEQTAGELIAVGTDLEVGDDVPLAVKDAGVACVGGAIHAEGAATEHRAGCDGGPQTSTQVNVRSQHRIGGGVLLRAVGQGAVDQGGEPDQLFDSSNLIDAVDLLRNFIIDE